MVEPRGDTMGKSVWGDRDRSGVRPTSASAARETERLTNKKNPVGQRREDSLPEGEYDLHKIGTLGPDTYVEPMDLPPDEPETENSSADCRGELALPSPAVPRQDRKGCVEGGGEAGGTEGDGRSGQISS